MCGINAEAASAEAFSREEEDGGVDEMELDCGYSVGCWGKGAGSGQIEAKGEAAGEQLRA